MSGFGQCDVHLLFHKFISSIPQRLGDLLSKLPSGAAFKIQTNDHLTASWKPLSPCISKGFALVYMTKTLFLQIETGVTGEVKIIPDSYKNSPHPVHHVPSEEEYEPS